MIIHRDLLLWRFSIDARDDRSVCLSPVARFLVCFLHTTNLSISEIIVCLRGNNTVLNITSSSLIMIDFALMASRV